MLTVPLVASGYETRSGQQGSQTATRNRTTGRDNAMGFTQEYVQGLAAKNGWGWLPMDQVTLAFGTDRDVLLMPLGFGAEVARLWLEGQRARYDQDPTGWPGNVWAMVHTVNAACPEMNQDGRYFGEGVMLALPPRLVSADAR